MVGLRQGPRRFSERCPKVDSLLFGEMRTSAHGTKGLTRPGARFPRYLHDGRGFRARSAGTADALPAPHANGGKRDRVVPDVERCRHCGRPAPRHTRLEIRSPALRVPPAPDHGRRQRRRHGGPGRRQCGRDLRQPRARRLPPLRSLERAVRADRGRRVRADRSGAHHTRRRRARASEPHVARRAAGRLSRRDLPGAPAGPTSRTRSRSRSTPAPG